MPVFGFLARCSPKVFYRLKKDSGFYREELKKAMVQGAEFASKTCLVRGAFGHGVTY